MTWHLEVIEGPDRGKKKELIPSGGVNIGRDSSSCGLVLSDDEVSRLHVRVFLSNVGGAVQLEDMGSTHGTFVNDARISEIVQVGPEDLIRVGSTRIRLMWAPEASESAGAEQRRSLASINIGRDPSSDLVINHPEVSRRHALIERQKAGCYLTDLNSTHGTYVNGEQIKGQVELKPSTWIQILDFKYSFDGINLFTEQGSIAAGFVPGLAEAGQPLSLLKALAAPFAGRESLKWLLGSLLSVVPIVSFFADGYRYRLLQNGYAGTIAMPEWDTWSEMFLKGLLFFLVRLTYLVVPVILNLLFFSLVFNSANPSMALIVVSLFAGLLCYCLFGFFLPMGWAHFAATGHFKDAFQFSEIFQSIKVVLGQYITIILLVVALWIVVILVSLIPIAGFVFAILGFFYVCIVSGLLFGEVYRLSQVMMQ